MRASDPYKTVFEVGATLSAELDRESVLATVARQIGEAMRATSCDINEYDDQAETLTYAAMWSQEMTAEDEAYIGTVVALADRPARLRVLRGRETVAYYLDDPDLDPIERALMERWHEPTALETPLVFGDQVIGIVGVVDKDLRRRYTDEDEALLRALAVPAAIAIHNAGVFAAEQERRRRLGGLLDASRAVTSTFGLDQMLDAVAREAAELLACSECLIYEYDDERHGMVWRTHYARDGVRPRPDVLGTFYSVEDWAADYDIMTEGGYSIDHVDDPGLTSVERQYMLDCGETSALTVALRFGREPIGVLYLMETASRREFDDRDVDLVTAFGELASAAIHNARLLDHQERQSGRLLRLFDVGRAITGALSTDEVVRALRAQAAGVVTGETGRVHVWLRDADEVLVPWGERAGAGFAPALSPAAEQAVATLAPAQEPSDPGTRLVLPFVSRGHAHGFMEIVDEGRRVFGPDLVELLHVIANQAAAALANARLYARVEAQAITDGLTGLYNHRYFYERLEEECARAQRYELPLSLLMIDIDDFKVFNDRYGHLRGDQVLRDVSRILAADTRHRIDIPARYGGEEFTVILPHTVLEGAGVAADRIQRRIADLEPPAGPEEQPVPPPGVDAVVVGERLRHDIETRAFAASPGVDAGVTVSIGAASVTAASAAPAVLVSRADEAMYAAKRAGKNRVEVWV